MPKDVLVIGGGVSGIQASLDLADMGLKVHLVEKLPSIGGRMAQLDKTFPTNDCSICILAPKMADCFGHENINTLTFSEVREVSGREGDFKVRVVKKARGVDETLCTGCGECIEKCPVKVPDEFNMGLSERKAIYLYFLQAVPRIATIDRDNCLMITKGKCGICKKVCQRGAVDYDQKDKEITLQVGAIIVAVGFDPYDPRNTSQYGYGRCKNVITALEYERLICASGPTGGHLVRPSDHKEANKIGYVQCVGSRDVRKNPYCSSVCCMHSTKEAILAQEHNPGVECFVFYTDIRAPGKDFQRYIKRGMAEYGVIYIRGRVAEIIQDEDENPVILYENTETDKVEHMKLDLVVLATSLVPRHGINEFANLLGVDLDNFGFIKTDPFNTVITTREGIFACGYCQSPQDIPESVAQASGAAEKAAEICFR
ncbi:MAG: CoB--CoM heterodisulfide reductase iron-sulfur subunit A family protein [bacterium]|nr:CoB--CoM heterodisulfide reductase iron-sulfur subunit A family protein [bacterium]